MEKYMTIGEVAKKAGVTVRALQYYDNVGLLQPASESEGGRRLYTHKEVVKLHQILSMKQLGFSLDEIKTRMPAANTPEEISNMLITQATEIKTKIDALTDMLEYVEKLNTEILQTHTVDWDKYATIFTLLKAKSELYWVAKHFSGNGLDHISMSDEDSIKSFIEIQNRLLEEAGTLQKAGIPPESEQGQAFAKAFWDLSMEVIGEDTHLLDEFEEIAKKHGDSKWKEKQDFIGKSVGIYISSLKKENE